MNTKKGRMIYVPKPVLMRLNEIKTRENIRKNSVAWDKMAFLTGVGLNVEDNITLPSLFPKKKGKKGGFF